MPSTRDDFHATLRRNERAMNRWRRALFEELEATWMRYAERGYDTPLIRALWREDLERITRTYYARWPGDVDAPLGRAILGQTGRTWGERFWAEWQDIRRRLRTEPALIRAIRGAS